MYPSVAGPSLPGEVLHQGHRAERDHGGVGPGVPGVLLSPRVAAPPGGSGLREADGRGALPWGTGGTRHHTADCLQGTFIRWCW